MPYEVQSQCRSCGNGDVFVIGQWTAHLGVHVCRQSRMLLNVPVETGACPGCGECPPADALYDYSFAVPYLGGQTIRELEAGPVCPKCEGASLTFNTTTHLNMGVVVHDVERARATWGRDYLEKAIFMNSSIPVIEEFQLDAEQVFDYFHLHLPTGPIATKRISFPILLDIRTHLWMLRQRDPNRFARAHRGPAPDGGLTQRQVRRRRE